jgi:hypothetical protein
VAGVLIAKVKGKGRKEKYGNIIGNFNFFWAYRCAYILDSYKIGFERKISI